MATTKNYYTGNGSTTAFTFTFPYLNTSHIKVKLDGVVQATTEYTLTPTSNPTTVNFNTAPTNLVPIEIYRETSLTTANNVFAAGSSVKAASLNNNQTQVLYALEEQENNIEKGEIFNYANANHSAGVTAPTTPSSGDTWFDSTSGRTYIYYVDTDSSQWVEANPPFDADGSRSFTQSGTGASARTWDSKLKEIVSLKDFGAVGDGTTNDTTAIINWLQSGNSFLYAPPGTYLVAAAGDDAGGAYATISNSITVLCAEGAVFKAGTGLDNDLIRITADATGYSATRNLSVNWTGGKFDQSGQKNSTVVPYDTTYSRASSLVGTSSTADALSIRGEVSISSTPTAGFYRVTVKDIQTYASADKHWKTAGGDSGLFISGTYHIHVSNGQFIGNRDLGIYVSGLSAGLITGGSCYIGQNIFYGCMFGAAAKRFLSNVQIVNNIGYNTAVVATSSDATDTGDHIVIANNIGYGAWRVVRAVQGTGYLIHGNQSYKHGVLDPTNSDAVLSSIFSTDNACVSLEGVTNSTIYGNSCYGLNTGISHQVHTVKAREDQITTTATSNVSTEIITSAGHDLAVGDAIYFDDLTNTTGITNNTIYYVSETSFSADAFRVTTDKDGAASGDIAFGGSNDTSLDIKKCCNKNFVHNNTADSVRGVITETQTYTSRELTSWGNYGRNISGTTLVELQGPSSIDKDGHLLDWNGTYNLTGTTSTTNILDTGKLEILTIGEDTAFRRDRIRITAAGTITGTNDTKTFSLKFNNTVTQETAFAAATVGMWYLDGYIEFNTPDSQRIYAQITCNDKVATLFSTGGAGLSSGDIALEFRNKLGNSSDTITTNTFSARWE